MCISILHAPGDDPNSYESASERWSPVQSVEKILLSVISMLAGESASLRSLIEKKDAKLTKSRLPVLQNRTSNRAPTSMHA